MPWWDFDVGRTAYGWYDQKLKKVPYNCFVWDDEELAIKYLPVANAQADKSYVVKEVVGNGKEWIVIEEGDN